MIGVLLGVLHSETHTEFLLHTIPIEYEIEGILMSKMSFLESETEKKNVSYILNLKLKKSLRKIRLLSLTIHKDAKSFCEEEFSENIKSQYFNIGGPGGLSYVLEAITHYS